MVGVRFCGDVVRRLAARMRRSGSLDAVNKRGSLLEEPEVEATAVAVRERVIADEMLR